MEDKKCVCGHLESEHVDACEQCFIVDCGCRQFEEVTLDRAAEKKIISDYMRSLAMKSVEAIKAKYGREHYVKMGKTKHARRPKKLKTEQSS